MSRRHILQFMGIGVIIALHWITFYGSIKIGSSVSLTLGCFGVVSFFTALLEPLLTGKPFRKIELLLGMFVLLGLYFIYKAKPDDEAAAANYMQAIGVGILSAFLASLFSTLNKKYIGTHSTVSMSVLELGSGFLFLSLILPFTDISHFTWIPEGWDILWILLLSVVCTNLAFFLGTDALKHVSAFTANLAVNMEPVYGIVLAALFFKEYQALNAWFYAGAGIILLTVLAHPFLEKLNKRKQTE